MTTLMAIARQAIVVDLIVRYCSQGEGGRFIRHSLMLNSGWLKMKAT